MKSDPLGFFYAIVVSLIIGLTAGGLIVTGVDSSMHVYPVAKCVMNAEQAVTEDEICAMWMDGDTVVVGPLWARPAGK